jgi:hypothetical protein
VVRIPRSVVTARMFHAAGNRRAARRGGNRKRVPTFASWSKNDADARAKLVALNAAAAFGRRLVQPTIPRKRK